MKKIVGMIITALAAVFFGVTVVSPPEKVYTTNAYYQPVIDSSPDYHKLYNQVNNVKDVSAGDCDRGKRSLLSVGSGNLVAHMNGTGASLFSSGKYWFYSWAPFSKSGGDLFKTNFLDHNSSRLTANKDGYCSELYGKPDDYVYIYKLSSSNCIIAPANGYIVLSSMKVTNPYPTDYISNNNVISGLDGTTFSYITTPTEGDSNYYKFVFGGVYRMWCCMLKSASECKYADTKNKTGPYFAHSYALTSDKEQFDAGDVLAQCGTSGVPQRTASANKSATYTFVKVYSSPDGSAWSPIKLESFYYPAS